MLLKSRKLQVVRRDGLKHMLPNRAELCSNRQIRVQSFRAAPETLKTTDDL